MYLITPLIFLKHFHTTIKYIVSNFFPLVTQKASRAFCSSCNILSSNSASPLVIHEICHKPSVFLSSTALNWLFPDRHHFYFQSYLFLCMRVVGLTESLKSDLCTRLFLSFRCWLNLDKDRRSIMLFLLRATF